MTWALEPKLRTVLDSDLQAGTLAVGGARVFKISRSHYAQLLRIPTNAIRLLGRDTFLE